jgi:ribosomal protein L40E
MKPRTEIDPRHQQIRGVLRIVGPCLLLAGLVLDAIGLVSFFSAFGSFEPPRYFWCLFLGFPLTAMGAGLTKFAYLGAIARYLSGEVSPVGKDTFNYLYEGTGERVRTIAHAVGQGLSSGLRGADAVEIRCPTCDAPNPADARYCDRCGAPLEDKACPRCGTRNGRDAKFCNQCGGQLP